MVGWFSVALFSMIAYSIKKILYKLAVKGGCHTVMLTQYMLLTMTMIGTLLLLFLRKDYSLFLLTFLIAVPYGIIYSIGTNLQLFSLIKTKAIVSFPLIRFNNLLPILFGILFLNEQLTVKNYLGISFVLISILLLKGEVKNG